MSPRSRRPADSLKLAQRLERLGARAPSCESACSCPSSPSSRSASCWWRWPPCAAGSCARGWCSPRCCSWPRLALELAIGRGRGDALLLGGVARLALVAGRPRRRRRPALQSVAPRSAVRPHPGDRPGRHRHRALRGGGDDAARREGAHHVGGRRRGRRLRAAGHAGQPLCRPGHPGREAVPRRPLDPGRRASRARCRR